MTDAGGIVAIVPAYNEEAAIGDVIDAIRASSPPSTWSWIDDGSGDATSVIARSHGARGPHPAYNLGIGGAVQTGFMYALKHGLPPWPSGSTATASTSRRSRQAARPDRAGEADIVDRLTLLAGCAPIARLWCAGSGSSGSPTSSRY